MIGNQKQPGIGVAKSGGGDASVTVNGNSVGSAPSGGVLALTLVDQDSNQVPFTQTGTELEVNTEFDLEINLNGDLIQIITLNSQENNTINLIL